MPDNTADSNLTQPLPSTPSTPANVTPFDTQLVDDPNVPRHTQPLPSQFAPSPTNASSQNAPLQNTSPPTYAPHSLPRQVVPDTDTSNIAATSSTRSAPQTPIAPPAVTNAPVNSPTSSLPASRVPLMTMVGLASVGGALAVVFGSALFRRIAPVPEAARGNSTVVIDKKSAPANTIIMKRPSETTKETGAPDQISRANNAAPTESVSPPNVIVSPVDDTPTRDNDSSNADIEYSISRDQNLSNTAERNNSNRNNSNRDHANSRNAATTNNSMTEAPSNRESADDDWSSENKPERNASPRFVEKRRAYSIQPPRDFRLTQKGRRTIWKGANGARLLVEVGKNDGETPRAGWEKLDRALQKKYGSRYQSRGIRDTTLNGRQAAIWEFDLRQKDGSVVRKMDVAVVDNDSGYAVLASAPIEEFEAMRPTWNRVLDSFKIEASDASDAVQNESETGQDDVTGY